MSLIEALEGEQDKLFNCVHCGFCLPVCPTYRRLGDEADSPRGRLHLMKAVVEGRLEPGSDAFQTHIDRCLGCRACETVCPSGVEYGQLLEVAREAAISARPQGLLIRVMLYLFSRPALLSTAMTLSRWLRATRLPDQLASRLSESGGGRRIRLASAMLAASGPDPRPLATVGVRHAAQGKVGGAGNGISGQPQGRVALLEGCVQRGLFGRVNRATVRVLEANGFQVVRVSGQRCCGALHAHAGALEGARALASANVTAFERADVEHVAVNAAGCGCTMKEYGHLLSRTPDLAERGASLALRVRDVSELLTGVGPRLGAPLDLRVAYDAPCHLLHGQRLEEEPRAVLKAIPQLDLVPLRDAEECCGGAGIYGITHAELASSIGGDKVAAILDSGAQAVATPNPGCMMQIGAGLRLAGSRISVWHPVELLDESYRRAGFYV